MLHSLAPWALLSIVVPSLALDACASASPSASAVGADTANATSVGTAPVAQPWAPLAERLASRGLPADFIGRVLERKDADRQKRVVELNTRGFLKTVDYSGHIDEQARTKSRAFLVKYRATFAEAKRRYQVPAEVVAALLWVETRHGKRMGNFPVLDAYAYTARAADPEILERNLADLGADVDPTTSEGARNREKLKTVSRTKAEWAVDQIVALQKMYAHYGVDVFRLKGSYAGAFGPPQFIPTSYLQWAVAKRKGARPDLFRMTDAILSVAHYLNEHGWGKDLEAQTTALYGYNRSKTYGQTILTLASQLRETPPPASAATGRNRMRASAESASVGVGARAKPRR